MENIKCHKDTHLPSAKTFVAKKKKTKASSQVFIIHVLDDIIHIIASVQVFP